MPPGRENASAEIDQQVAQCGARLRELRAARGWTLDELAERTALSKPFLSRLEAGDRRPSIAAVLTLARTFGVTLEALFGDPAAPAEPCVVVRGADAPRREGDGLSYVSLSSAARFTNLQPMRLTIAADRRGDERYQHEGEEWVYVVRGGIRLLVGERAYDLSEGDAAHFDSRVPHRLAAAGGKDADVIVVACPLPEDGPRVPDEPRRRRVRSRRAVG